MIHTASYNDLTSLSYEQRRDADFLFNLFAEFHARGGDVSLPVRLSHQESHHNNQVVILIEFQDFLQRYVNDAPVLLARMLQAGMLREQFSFSWNAQNAAIEEPRLFSLSWMRENYEQYTDLILQSLEQLLNKLPEDITQVKEFISYGHAGQVESHQYQHPFIHITERLAHAGVYDKILSLKPQSKSLWQRQTRSGKFVLEQAIDGAYSEVRKPGIAITLYKHGVGHEYFAMEDNWHKMHDLIKHAVYKNDFDFLNQVLPRVDLNKIENTLSLSDMTLLHAKTAQMAKLLLEHGAVFEQKSNDSSQSIIGYSSFTNIQTFDAILETNPRERAKVVAEPDDYYTMLCHKPFAFTRLLVEKYAFPLQHYDMLTVALKSRLPVQEVIDIEPYQWLAQHGADFTQCRDFCAGIVDKKEEGLKLLKTLNKSGVLLASSPDVAFHIFQKKPLKNFQKYYEKMTAEQWQQYTREGLPAWWGAVSESGIFQRTNMPWQTATDSMPLVYHLYKSKAQKVSRVEPEDIISRQLSRIALKNPQYQMDFSYLDSEGNNLWHWVVELAAYEVNQFYDKLMKKLESASQQALWQLLLQPNYQGKRAIEVAFERRHDYVLRQMYEACQDTLNYHLVLSDGTTLGEQLMQVYVSKPQEVANIRMRMMEEILPEQPQHSNTRKPKL